MGATPKKLALGIDTGGTYTDAVLVDQTGGGVLAANKALTTRHDLAVGIGRAVEAVLESARKAGPALSPADIDMVGLSTTLATNAIVEGQGSPVCLLLLGYDPDLIRQYGFERELVTEDVVYLQGGHDAEGNETASLDEAGVREAILSHRGRVEAFAVSGYFGVRNPTHELRVRELVEELTAPAGGGMPLPVTCGHELTAGLNAVRRATTVVLNASLIPLLRDLTATVRRTLDAHRISAPLMVVKGDGSLVRADWAMQRPIETVLSGPAASVVGAWHLADRRDVWVVDMGGTTSDIAELRDGRPRLNPEGARVGGWRTLVETADVHTVGLGGDSHVTLSASANLAVGPRRVVPLCLLADEHPGVLSMLQRPSSDGEPPNLVGQFLLSHRRSTNGLPDADRDLLNRLEDGPRSLLDLAQTMPLGLLDVRQVRRLEARRLVLRAGFTPTDALHVLGRFQRWDARASRLGAERLCAPLGLSPEAFCERVVAEVSARLTAELAGKVLFDEAHLTDWGRSPVAAALLARALGVAAGSGLDCQFTLRHPLVAVGAPVAAYLPGTAAHLHTELVVPPHAEVANAVGAVAGSVVQRQQVLIRPLRAKKPFRLHLPDGVHDFAGLEEAIEHARQVVPGMLEALARQAGAEHVEVREDRTDRSAPTATGGEEVFVETQLTFTAVGRPSSVETNTRTHPAARQERA